MEQNVSNHCEMGGEDDEEFNPFFFFCHRLDIRLATTEFELTPSCKGSTHFHHCDKEPLAGGEDLKLVKLYTCLLSAVSEYFMGEHSMYSFYYLI